MERCEDVWPKLILILILSATRTNPLYESLNEEIVNCRDCLPRWHRIFRNAEFVYPRLIAKVNDLADMDEYNINLSEGQISRSGR